MTRLNFVALSLVGITTVAMTFTAWLLQAELSFERRKCGEWQERALMAEHELAFNRRFEAVQNDRIEQLQDEIARRVLPPGEQPGFLPRAKKQ